MHGSSWNKQYDVNKILTKLNKSVHISHFKYGYPKLPGPEPKIFTKKWLGHYRILGRKSSSTSRAITSKLNMQAVILWVDIMGLVAVVRAIFSDGLSAASNVNLHVIIIAVGHITLDIKCGPCQLNCITRTNSNVKLAILVVFIIWPIIVVWWCYFSRWTRKHLVTRSCKKQ